MINNVLSYPQNNPYLQSINSMLQQAPQPAPQTAPPQYVNGRQSAEAYQMQPNTSAVLWDSGSDKFYLKTADASGFCTIKSFIFHEETPKALEEYVTKADFEALKAELEQIRNRITTEEGMK